MSEYKATLIRVIDGDTAVFDLKRTYFELGHKKTKVFHNITCRFLGINTPERGQRGYYEAKGHTNYELVQADNIIIKTDDSVDVFNRLLGTVFVDGNDLNQELLELGLAIPYVK